MFNTSIFRNCLLIGIAICLNLSILDAKKPFTHEDAMKFKSIRNTRITDNGKWLAYTSVPDRGDGELIVINPNAKDTNRTIIPRGDRALFTKDGIWLAAAVLPKQLEVANAKSPKDRPKNGLAILRNATGEIVNIDNVEKYEFSNDSQWLLYRKFKDDKSKSESMKKKAIGSEFIIRHLLSGTEITVPFVTEYLIDSAATKLFYTISSPDGKKDGVYWRDLKANFIPESAINSVENTAYSALAWNPKRNTLAYISTTLRKDGRTDNGNLLLWDYRKPALTQFAVTSQALKDGYYIPSNNKTKWTEDGLKLFFGIKPIAEKDTIDFEDIKTTEDNFYNLDTLQNNADDRIWHWNDDRINTNQENWWNKNKNRTFASVYDIDSKAFFQLADENITDVTYSDNSDFTVGYDETKYLRTSTWGGFYSDLYLFDLNTGEKKLIADSLIEKSSLSPMGKYVVFYKQKDWYVHNNESGSIDKLTRKTTANFYNVEQDIPFEPYSYGVCGWSQNDKSVLIHGEYDVFRFIPSDPGTFLNITGTVGANTKIRFRYKNLNPDKKVFFERDTIFFEGYSEVLKSYNMYWVEAHIIGGINLNTKGGIGFTGEKDYFFVAKPKYAPNIVYTRESFDEFPDIWFATNFLDSARKVSDANPQMKDFIWGTTEPVKWKAPYGDSLDGYLIKPDNYDPNKKYPVLVYFYERFSQQTYRFYQPRLNHRPLYQSYLGDGYLVFVPDVIYHTGRPGMDANDAITSGVQYLIDKGIADPAKLCIQGHSWGAYQTAYIVTQTDMFAAASAGAPVGNMTSAYSGIRLESGLARQFQYEHYQSRIGGNLWDSLDSYIRNSPVFQAEKQTTPLLIIHGDIDNAVPFSQGVELFLALRRLSKNSVLVEYKDEPHHPQKYENKVDWAIKMKEWFDHYVLGKPAPKWITEGRVYMGNK